MEIVVASSNKSVAFVNSLKMKFEQILESAVRGKYNVRAKYGDIVIYLEADKGYIYTSYYFRAELPNGELAEYSSTDMNPLFSQLANVLRFTHQY